MLTSIREESKYFAWMSAIETEYVQSVHLCEGGGGIAYTIVRQYVSMRGQVDTNKILLALA